MLPRRLRSLALLALVTATSAAGQPLPPRPVTAAQRAIALGVAPLAADALGRPHLLVAQGGPALARATPADAARAHVARLAAIWDVDAARLPALETAGEVAVRGGTITRLRQVIDGLPVAGRELRVLTTPAGALVAVNGALVGTAAPRTSARFRDDAATATAAAVRHAHAGATDAITVESQAARVWFPQGRTLVAAWSIEAYSRRPGGALVLYRTVLAAATGAVLAHVDLRSDAAHAYRVFAGGPADPRPTDNPQADYSPHPTGTPDGAVPPYVAPVLVTVDGLNHPAGSATPDPWLPAGATGTLGNNIDAFADLDDDGAPDFRATPTAAATFDRTYDPTLAPTASQSQMMAALAQVFYTTNYQHDFWYDAGFTEAAGNGQADNFGRGGVGGDRVRVRTHNGAGLADPYRDNAYMFTPSEGMSPEMRVFVWTPSPPRSTLTIGPANRTPEHAAALFGPTDFDVTAPLVAGIDGTGLDPGDGCEPLTNDVTGKIVLLQRYGCTEKAAAVNVQAAGGIGILVQSDEDGPPRAPGRDNTIATPITVGVFGIRKSEGAALRAELAAGPVTAHLAYDTQAMGDGSLDATVIAHELGHYLHHRLSECSESTACTGMSEGWGDFAALLLMARAGDDLDGTYAIAGYAYQQDPRSQYFGLRRVPYSVDPARNALRFRHVGDDARLPAHPVSPSPLPNSQVHNAGEIWASTLWEVYVALQRAHPGAFEATRATMAAYVVAGLLLVPPEATHLETRDAILAAARAASPEDHRVMADAFARRGMGTCAVGPARTSETLAGIVESDVAGGQAVLGAVVVTPIDRCDDDAILDAGETVQIAVPITNTGIAPLTNVTVAAVASGPAVTSEPVTLASLGVAEQQTVMLTATIGAADLAAGTLAVTVTAPDGCATTLSVPLAARLNADDTPAASATDHFDADSIWTTAGGWAHVVEAGTDRAWQTAEAGTLRDASVASPGVTAGTGPLTVTFATAYRFDTRGTVPLEGGVVELTTDGGSTWHDVTEYGVDPYDGRVDPGITTVVAGRRAFTGTAAARTVRLDFGTMLAGQTFRLRFRAGTAPESTGASWTVDDVAFTGITGTPFPVQADEPGDCALDGGDDDGGCCQTGAAPAPVAWLAGLLGLALVARRRRRA